MLSQVRKRKINPLLMNVIIACAALHVAALVILGGITIVKYVIPDEAAFEEPPAVEEEQPPPEVKVEIKQRPPQLNQSLNNLKMKQVGNIAVADVNVNLPGMDQSFTVSSGLGNFGGGSLLGGTRGSLGIGMSDVSVFGLKTKAERILFVIDAGGDMAVDAKGGLASYQVIKDEISTMVANLSAGTLFNVAVYNRRNIKYFKPQLVPAGAEISNQLTAWIGRITPSSTQSSLGGSTMALNALNENVTQSNLLWSAQRGNETMTLTQNILEQGVDAAFIITGYHQGFESVRRKPTDRENAEWKRTTDKKSYQDQLAAHNAEKPQMEQRVAAELARINRERAAKGQPPRVLASQWGIYSKVNDLSMKWNTPHPGWQQAYLIEPRTLQSYFRGLIELLYTDKGATEPSINVVLFLAGDENLRKDDERSLKDYVRLFGGKQRIIRGADEIKDARSAKDTKN